jgi:hypothetical protein
MRKNKVDKNLCFVGLSVNERNPLGKIKQRLLSVQSRYFHLEFERIFAAFPFLRSFHQTGLARTNQYWGGGRYTPTPNWSGQPWYQKIRTFNAYVEKEN